MYVSHIRIMGTVHKDLNDMIFKSKVANIIISYNKIKFCIRSM